MTFAEKMQVFIEKGLDATKDFANKAGDKAKELGAMGVLKLEIGQLQVHAEKLIAKLGNEVYMMLVDKNHATVSRDTPAIRDNLKAIEDLRAMIEVKEREYQSIGGKDAIA